MLPEYFRKNGYFTAQIGKIYHTEDGFEDPRSWDIEIREFGKRPSEEEIIKWDEPGGAGQHTIDWAWLKTPDEKTPDGIVARRAVEIMKEAAKREQPFFLGIGFRRPHAPYAAPKKYFDLYPPDSIKLPEAVPSGHFANLLPAAVNHPPRSRPLSEREQRELIAAYSRLHFVCRCASKSRARRGERARRMGQHGHRAAWRSRLSPWRTWRPVAQDVAI